MKPCSNPVHSQYIAFSPNCITKSFFVTFASALLMCATWWGYLMTSVVFLSALGSLPPRPLSAPRPPQPRLNGWAALWKTVAVLIHKPPSLCSRLCLQGSALRWAYWIHEEGFQSRQWQTSTIVAIIIGQSLELCAASSAKLCIDSGKQLTVLKAFSHCVAFEWSFWNVPL